jgi:hypothetical protein
MESRNMRFAIIEEILIVATRNRENFSAIALLKS